MYKRFEKSITVLFLIGILILGYFITDDFGMSWDENYSRNETGAIAYNYVFRHDLTYQTADERYHGTAIELPLYCGEKLFNLTDLRSIYLFRHFITFLIFLISAIFFYLLIKEIYFQWWIAFAGLVIYIFTPRIFADAFYNSKDIGFLAFFTIGMFSAFHFLKSVNIKTILFHGIVCGFLTAIRITGIILPVLTIIFLFIRQFRNTPEYTYKKLLTSIGLFLIIAILTMILFWPILWFGPVTEFQNAWNELSHFQWNKDVLYFGNFISETNIPWHYIPVWIFITTPVATICLLISGFILLIVKNFNSFWVPDKITFINNFFICCLSMPVLAIIFLHSIVYDGWRHVYFLHGPMIALVCYSLFRIQNSGKFIKVINYVFLSLYLPVLLTMYRIHPFNNIYFNNIIFKNISDARFKMDMDYWGLSYRKGLENLLRNDKRNTIHIKVDTYPGKLNASLLPLSKRNRIMFEDDIKNAEYFIGNYRWMNTEYPYKTEIYSVNIDGAKILVTYKLK